jgi:putative tryptophan/tyrosine transport system substrate-binding protein
VDRRRFLQTVSASLLPTPLAAEAQQTAKIYRLGILSPAAAPDPSVATSPNLVPLALRELGYVAGRNLVVERRFAEGKSDRLRELARELVQLKVDVIVAVSDDAIQAARDVTVTIPVVMAFGNSPVERGFVASLARPGGNVTGVRYEGSGEGQLTGKRLELIKETIPRAARIAVLTTGESGSRAQVQAAQKVAPVLGVKLIVVEAQGTDYERAFATMVAERADALFVVSSTILNRDRKQIIERAAKYRLPAMYEWREQVEVGGLMSYGSSTVDLSRRVAVYVDRILKGEKPADLPVEQPTKYGLVINLKTAKALGLTIPQSLLRLADQIIE